MDTVKQAHIYGLYDPETGQLRYIGQSAVPENRFRGHMWTWTDWPVAKWFQGLLADGKVPRMEILRTVRYEERFDHEMAAIQEQLANENELLNSIVRGRPKRKLEKPEDPAKASLGTLVPEELMEILRRSAFYNDRSVSEQLTHILEQHYGV